MIYKIQELIIFLSAIAIGIPLGLIVGLICWFKFPFQIYWEARSKLAQIRIEKAEQLIEQYKKDNSNEGMWERHIERIKSKENYDN
tara:strand:+ start:1324 stop:1581 length:258 start_codon:yes stop_codon:yes gene_type:complete